MSKYETWSCSLFALLLKCFQKHLSPFISHTQYFIFWRQVFLSLLKKISPFGLRAADVFVEWNSILVIVGCGCRSVSTPKSNKKYNRTANISLNFHTLQWINAIQWMGESFKMFFNVTWIPTNLCVWKAPQPCRRSCLDPTAGHKLIS